VEDSERATHARSFGPAAADYDRHRPDYAPAAVAWALEHAPGKRVLDLGAGTGKLTRMLLDMGLDVAAVDPDEAMLAALRGNLPSVKASLGRAEQIPLPDGSVDAVLVGQALHWFDMDAAGPEIWRVLTPGGVLAGLWNLDDDRVPWVAALEEATEGTGAATLSQWQRDDHEAHFVTLPFPDAERAQFPHGQARTADSLTATIATHSRVLVLDPPSRARLVARVREFLAGNPETADGDFTFPLVTAAIRCARLLT
jgi:SAM-dependent methyltransferase